MRTQNYRIFFLQAIFFENFNILDQNSKRAHDFMSKMLNICENCSFLTNYFFENFEFDPCFLLKNDPFLYLFGKKYHFFAINVFFCFKKVEIF